MVLITHIVLAFISVIFALYTALFPSKIKLRATYLLTLGTVVSGFILLVTRPANLGQTYISGIIYLGFMVAVSTLARKKFAKKVV